MTVTIADIQEAAQRLRGHVLRTPTVAAPALSQLTGADVWLKLENLQYTASFKVRGAFNHLSQLDAAGRAAGVVAASAGNHAQGVAFHARTLGIPAVIVMPKDTPFTKVSRTEALGATVVLHGADIAAAGRKAQEMAAAEGRCFVHPYDDAAIVAGQGTVGLEMLADAPPLDVLIVPVGGGGLIAGIAVAAAALSPATEIVGVEAASYASMREAIRGEGVSSGGATCAEGIAVTVPGVLTRPLIEAHVADILLAGEDAIECAVQAFIEEQRLVVEGAGAAPLAALIENAARFAGRRVGLVVSGGNIDSRLLASILMRGLVRAGRLVRLRIEIADRPGTLAHVSGIIGEAGGNIVEVYHQRLFHDVPVKMAELDVVVETLDVHHVRALMAALENAGFGVRLLSSTALDHPG